MKDGPLEENEEQLKIAVKMDQRSKRPDQWDKNQ